MRLSSLFCTIGMYCGLLLDCWLSPTKTIPFVCKEGGNLFAEIWLHLTLMPMAHLGMVLAGASCVIVNYTARTVKGSSVPLVMSRQLLEMFMVEAATIWLFSPKVRPETMMLIMGGFMLARPLAYQSIRTLRMLPVLGPEPLKAISKSVAI